MTGISIPENRKTPSVQFMSNTCEVVGFSDKETYLALIEILLSADAMAKHIERSCAAFYGRQLSRDDMERYNYERTLVDQYNEQAKKALPFVDDARKRILK